MTLRELIHGAPTPPNPPQYVAWYRDGWQGSIQYLAAEVEPGEWATTSKIALAHRFDTREEADAATPDGILRRGVLQVRGSRDS
jgi:hypothetical protein